MNVSENMQEITDLLLSSGNVDKHYAPGYHTTNLYQIVKSNNVNMVKYLLESKDSFSPSALACVLWYAITHEYHEIAKLLVEHGADVNQRGFRSHFYDPRITLLSWAAYCKNKHAVKLLLKHGAKVNDFDLLGMGALYFAISTKRLKITRLLLDNGANVDYKDDHGNSMLHIAAGTGVAELIKLVHKFSSDVKVVNNYGQNVLHYAIQGSYDFKHIVVLLVKLGVPINGEDNHKETPLHYALSLRKNRMAEALIDNDADIKALSKEKVFPLFLAVASGCSHELVNKILCKGADINQKTIDGDTVLHWACRNEDDEQISILLSHKANVNDLNTSGQTPLSLIKNKKSVAAQVLLQHIAKLKMNCSFILEQNLELIAKDVDLHNSFQHYRSES